MQVNAGQAQTGTTTAGEYRRRPSVFSGAAALLAVALLLPACAADPSQPAPSSPPAASQAAAPAPVQSESPAAAGTAPVPDIPVRPATPESTAAAPSPVSLTVAGTSIDMPVVPVGVVEGGAMEIPDAFDRAGWYRFGPAPGAAAGTAVIAGHIDTKSDTAPFSQLKTVAAGTLVQVGRQGAPALNYRVVSVELMAKDRFDGSSVFRRSGPHELKVVTCGGKWLDERMDYSDNVIVTAVLE
ncbi:class F sortase [Pseudarthrobacter sp. L1SW]|uniref:class F sortase n=1 Tax=Pseudarthrobacter sp. L1SW TaxID=2851598 RepID=UPI001E42E712|nr:class F sortase [Pseudarthrobacter sp. L1SW]UEL28900.1 class F sortase [Pseudarthrobacter sp. L1SW]